MDWLGGTGHPQRHLATRMRTARPIHHSSALATRHRAPALSLAWPGPNLGAVGRGLGVPPRMPCLSPGGAGQRVPAALGVSQPSLSSQRPVTSSRTCVAGAALRTRTCTASPGAGRVASPLPSTLALSGITPWAQGMVGDTHPSQSTLCGWEDKEEGVPHECVSCSVRPRAPGSTVSPFPPCPRGAAQSQRQ